MPVRLFTLHGYRTWMPDHERGYARRDAGVVPADPNMAYRYEARARDDEVRFDERRQRIVVESAEEVCVTIDVRLYHAVCVDTHAHVLCGGQAIVHLKGYTTASSALSR